MIVNAGELEDEVMEMYRTGIGYIDPYLDYMTPEEIREMYGSNPKYDYITKETE